MDVHDRKMRRTKLNILVCSISNSQNNLYILLVRKLIYISNPVK